MMWRLWSQSKHCPIKTQIYVQYVPIILLYWVLELFSYISTFIGSIMWTWTHNYIYIPKMKMKRKKIFATYAFVFNSNCTSITAILLMWPKQMTKNVIVARWNNVCKVYTAHSTTHTTQLMTLTLSAIWVKWPPVQSLQYEPATPPTTTIITKTTVERCNWFQSMNFLQWNETWSRFCSDCFLFCCCSLKMTLCAKSKRYETMKSVWGS